MNHRLTAWHPLLAIIILLLAGRVNAQQSDDRESKARELFGVGRYGDALEIYGKLYAETTHPTYLRNIGRCYQNLGQPEKAVSSFREYLRQAKDLSADQRRVVEGYIHEMEELQRSRTASAAAASNPPPKAAAPPPAAPPPIPAAEPALSAPRAADPEPSSGGSTRRIIGWSIAGAGVVGAAVGVAYLMKASNKNSEAKKLCMVNNECANEDERIRHEQYVTEAKDAQKVAIISLVAGGAALIGGSILALTGGDDKGEKTARLVPWTGANEAGLAVVGTW